MVGAVVLGGAEIDGLTDSKELTKKRREELDIIIRDQASGFGLGWVGANEIDEIGLSASLVLATKRAVEQVKAPYHEIIIDGTINFLADTSKGKYVKALKKADLLIPSVSAASIIAKVARDNYMAEQDLIFPGYGFKSHVGYGTAVHRSAIDKLGVTPLHRLSFAPLKKFKKAPTRPDIVQENVTTRIRSTKAIGDDAETEAARYLMRQGHKIIDRNWRTKFCEIDIVSKLGDVIYFTEVKYRKKPDQGGGLAAITTKKLRQMKFAAEYYAAINQSIDTKLRLAAISLTGVQPTVEVFLEIK